MTLSLTTQRQLKKITFETSIANGILNIWLNKYCTESQLSVFGVFISYYYVLIIDRLQYKLHCIHAKVPTVDLSQMKIPSKQLQI